MADSLADGLSSTYEKSLMGVSEMGESMQRFGWVDYIMFIFMLGICVFVGLYFGICKKSQTSQDYLVASRSMGVIPIAMSLLASWVSGISLLGIPTEVYVYGVQYAYILGGFFLATLLMKSVYLPVFQGLALTSTYEGGLKGVVWTDVIQLVVMFAALLLVIIKGTINVGGIWNVIERNWESGRIEGPNFDLDPLSRHTIWALIIGGTAYTVQTTGVNQNMIQRYLSLPSMKEGRRALWAFFFGIVILMSCCCYCGMLIYATFHKCDPLTTMLAREKDQLLPLLVMEILGDIPGLPGIFVAGIFSAALSSLSTGLNAMAAIVLEDFYKPFINKQITEKQAFFLMKSTVIITGAICIGLVFIVEKLGAVLQLTINIGSIANGPALGLSTMGILLPWVNAKGALIGSATSLIVMCWVCLRAQSLVASGDVTFPEKPVSTEDCHYHFTPKPFILNDLTHTDEQFMIYRLSYMWYCLLGMLIAMIIGLVVSFLTKPLDPRDVDPKLLAPFIRRWIKPRKYPNQPDDGIIYAYGPTLKDKDTVDKKESVQLKTFNGPT
ncbi:sodium-coupled monocarboxylate transporter 1 isoform X3 [Leptinotarsa decemlineata]|uniref:sodium-coupled monocarboxylate transporter 1 isoform X3 n=1 Tax=Leptinotarsa decemlineata TaxID=7539 RepID=UPI003D3072E5